MSVTQSCQRVGRVGAHKATPGDDDGGMMLKMKIDDDEDVDLKVPNARICRTVHTDRLLVKDSKIQNLRIYGTVVTNRQRASN